MKVKGPGEPAGRVGSLLSRLTGRRHRGASLQEGWVIANHILVSFHVAFISSVLALPPESIVKWEVLQFIFTSWETLVSAAFMYVTFHCGIAFHELGHLVAAVRLNALNESVLAEFQQRMRASLPARVVFLVGLILRIPYGSALGIKREGLNYYPDAPYNLAVAAAGPRASRNLALVTLLPAVAALAFGLGQGELVAIYVGRLLLGIGLVAFLDFRLADPGKYAEFRDRERQAAQKARSVGDVSGFAKRAADAKHRMLEGRMQRATHPRLGLVMAPWQFRNCGMGGRHTEKEYPESNVSMQEAMFLILRASDCQQAQEMTVRLQTRLKEIIESEEGCRVMGIGLEGGLAPYIEKGDFPLPEVRLWVMMKRAIVECGYVPGTDVAIALDPALSELEIAYREENNVPDAVGMYLFWRDKAKVQLDRDAVLDIYVRAIDEFEVPILSIEDGFAEDDDEGWRMLLDRLGDRIFVIGDDLVTTNDRTIERAAEQGLCNAALIKANQIGSLYETLLAMLVALGKGQELVVSHRSKSPNDDMEAHIALAVNSLGLKAGGGSNTERLVKYQAVAELLLKADEPTAKSALREGASALVRKLRAYEEPTNAGIPTVGATVEVEVPDAGVTLRFRGATPLGTSAGTGEAIHLVDSVIEGAEHREVLDRYRDLLREIEPGVYGFKKGIDEARIKAEGHEGLSTVFGRAMRYGGKGCLNAVDNVRQIIAPKFEGKDLAELSLLDIDRELLALELATARRRGKIHSGADDEEIVRVVQRKQNLGMNGMLSSSLALARALAQVRGKELYELLREEVLSIVDRVAARYEVSVEGSRWDDYVAALREVSRCVADQDEQLHAVLRDVTGLYRDLDGKPAARDAVAAKPAPRAKPERRAEPGPRPPEQVEPQPDAPKKAKPAKPVRAAAARDASPELSVQPLPAALGDRELQGIDEVNRLLDRAWGSCRPRANPREALRQYVRAARQIARKVGEFGVVNNRLQRSEGRLLIPLHVGDALLIYEVDDGTSRLVSSHRLPRGTIVTDALVSELGSFSGEIVDLESELFLFDVDRATVGRFGQIRDIAALLGRINDSPNRNQAVFWIRHLVAHLCNTSARSYLSAKNLQPEVRALVAEMVRLLAPDLGGRPLLLARLLVRSLSAIVGRPNLIDRLWSDTIDLAEVHVRGSAVVNELRRSSHHALGDKTLRIAKAYLEYLETGATTSLEAEGFGGVAPADEQARSQEVPREILRRVVFDLERLLGTAEVVTRIDDWRETYGEALLACQFGSRIQDEVETVASDAIAAKNRWVYSHHLRILKDKAASFAGDERIGSELASTLAELEKRLPDDAAFDGEAAEHRLRSAVESFLADLRKAHQDQLFASLDELLDSFQRGAHYETFTRARDLRVAVHHKLGQGLPNELRYHLYHLDCLLEEMGYLTLGHVASAFADDGIDLDQCLRIVQVCIFNLRYDGLASRELFDLGVMLTDRSKTDAELLNVLKGVERCYHKILRRVTVPYLRLQQRLGLGDDELRAVLANMQRYLHDLSSMVQLSDLAATFVRDQLAKGIPVRRAVRRSVRREDIAAEIVHLSHRDEIARIVEEVGLPNPRERYGGKGSGLLYISYLHIPTRDGFILPTSIPRAGLHVGEEAWLQGQIREHVALLERDLAADGSSRRFGSDQSALLLAVRGGSVFSMPGMLSTVVFVGMNDRIAKALAEDDPWFAYDSYRRFLASFAQAVWSLDLEALGLVDDAKRRHGVDSKEDLPWEAMKEVAEAKKAAIREAGFGDELEEILADPMRQLDRAVRAVFDSWDTAAARQYREIKQLCHSWQTAVIVQEMAFGNRANEAIGPDMDETSASLTGVIPRTTTTEAGLRAFAGDIKFTAAGDDLVGGLTASQSLRSVTELETLMPRLEARLKHVIAELRRFMGTDQEVEFTVDHGVLSVLQSRAAETAADKAARGFDDPGPPVTRGLGVRGGGFRGVVAFDEIDRDELRGSEILRRKDVDGIMMIAENPTPADIPMIISVDGLLTARGGSTSHAAVAINAIEERSYSAVMSAEGLRVDPPEHEARLVDEAGKVHRIVTGDVLSIHGTTGEVYVGSRALRDGRRA
ncbi:MAG: hypothetical protein JRI23_03740 [Deltaproteobacteria bacterium]|nr:hypothetical protein [Deltaproteobacteria bacterium]MBW2530631.1 hypothetical protein [Deltaproteobacteria bacterium]